ncbi:unnamed protein product, partial [Nesidiocoris tenuis]
SVLRAAEAAVFACAALVRRRQLTRGPSLELNRRRLRYAAASAIRNGASAAPNAFGRCRRGFDSFFIEGVFPV